MPRHIERIIGRSDCGEPVGRSPVAALRRGEVAVQQAELALRVDAGGDDEGVVGERPVEGQHLEAAPAPFAMSPRVAATSA